MSQIKPAFQGEVQFRRWSDSSTQGVQVTFALPDSKELEPLKGKEGRRFMAVLVEIGDDEQPVEQAPARKGGGFKDCGPKCREAIGLCDMPEFAQWCEVKTAEDAKAVLLAKCGGISSRKELDSDQIAGELFIERIRVPFMKWQREQQGLRT